MEEISRYFPMELVRDVFSSLPVKSLVRFRCVCKAWHSLISSPDFASLHFSRYHGRDDHTHFLAATTDGPLKLRWMLLSSYTYEKNIDDFAILNNQNILNGVDHCCPRGSSINGLILLSNESTDPSTDLLDGGCQIELILWNPMLGKIHKLPSHCIDRGTIFGFGFSSSNNDYKVVAIKATEEMTSVQVYSLNTGTWRYIVEYRESILHKLFSDGILLTEGIVNFQSINNDEPSSHMVLFDVDNEVFRYIELPGRRFLSYAVVYHEKVGMLDFDDMDSCFDLWVMEKNWVPKSWHKLCRIDLHGNGLPRVLCFKENGEFMVSYDRGEVYVHDVESGEVKDIRDNSPYQMVCCTPYKENLMFM